jgi:hypothetical protein
MRFVALRLGRQPRLGADFRALFARPRWKTAIAGVSLLALLACGKEETSQDLVTKAQQSHAKGDDKTAQIYLRSALQKNPMMAHGI